jgi:hypothetical protein
LTLPALRGKIRRYFDERYGPQYVIFLFMSCSSRCYTRVQKVLPRERASSLIRTVERTFEYDILIGMGLDVMEAPA